MSVILNPTSFVIEPFVIGIPHVLQFTGRVVFLICFKCDHIHHLHVLSIHYSENYFI